MFVIVQLDIYFSNGSLDDHFAVYDYFLTVNAQLNAHCSFLHNYFHVYDYFLGVTVQLHIYGSYLRDCFAAYGHLSAVNLCSCSV